MPPSRPRPTAGVPVLQLQASPGDANFTVQGTLVAGAPELDGRGTGLAFTAMLCLVGLNTRRKVTA